MTHNVFTLDTDEKMITVADITDVELWELFTGRQVTGDERMKFQYPDYESDSLINKGFPVKWNELVGLKNIVVNVSLSLADYLLLLLWIRRVKFEMELSLKTGDILILINDAYNLSTADTPPADSRTVELLMEFALDTLLKRGHLQAKRMKCRKMSKNGQTEIHRTRVFSLTLAGRITAKNVFNNPESAHIEPVIDNSRVKYEKWEPYIIGKPDDISVADCEKHESTVTRLQRTKCRVMPPTEPDIAELPSIESKATIADSESQPVQKSKQSRQRVSEDDLTEAVKLIFDRGMSRHQAEKARGLPQGALSKGKGKKRIKEYQQMLCYKEPVDKDIADDYIHNEIRKNKSSKKHRRHRAFA